jgi:hypothetical protein
MRDVSVAFTHAATGLPTPLAAAFVWSAEHLHGLPLARGGTVEALTGKTMPPVLLINDTHDPIVPPDHARRLAAVIAGATSWQTSFLETSPFGTHIKSYRLGPAAYVARVTTFLDAALR